VRRRELYESIILDAITRRYTESPKGVFSLRTPEQLPKASEKLPLESRVQHLRGQFEQLASTIRKQLGEDDARTVRAGEVSDALQRLEWAISRLPEEQM
jgi:hypothetical protein